MAERPRQVRRGRRAGRRRRRRLDARDEHVRLRQRRRPRSVPGERLRRRHVLPKPRRRHVRGRLGGDADRRPRERNEREHHRRERRRVARLLRLEHRYVLEEHQSRLPDRRDDHQQHGRHPPEVVPVPLGEQALFEPRRRGRKETVHPGAGRAVRAGGPRLGVGGGLLRLRERRRRRRVPLHRVARRVYGGEPEEADVLERRRRLLPRQSEVTGGAGEQRAERRRRGRGPGRRRGPRR